MISLKTGVRIIGLRSELLLGIQIVHSIYKDNNSNLEITCGTDGVHSTGSLHYSGNAVDLGIHTIKNPAILAIVIRKALGEDFDLVHEDVGLPNEHFHLEYQPKRDY